MGRRSRTRSASDPAPARRAATPPPRRERASGGLSHVRRVLTVYLGCAMAIAVATVLGIAGLGGRLGPFVVVAYVAVGAGLLVRWARARLAGYDMDEEDRMMQTLGSGMLGISLALAVLSAVLVTVL